jgi:hypothetical protein
MAAGAEEERAVEAAVPGQVLQEEQQEQQQAQQQEQQAAQQAQREPRAVPQGLLGAPQRREQTVAHQQLAAQWEREPLQALYWEMPRAALKETHLARAVQEQSAVECRLKIQTASLRM